MSRDFEASKKKDQKKRGDNRSSLLKITRQNFKWLRRNSRGKTITWVSQLKFKVYNTKSQDIKSKQNKQVNKPKSKIK